jgi:hypothetical protein
MSLGVGVGSVQFIVFWFSQFSLSALSLFSPSIVTAASVTMGPWSITVWVWTGTGAFAAAGCDLLKLVESDCLIVPLQ